MSAYDTCLNCGGEITDPTNPSEETRYIHLETLEAACHPDDLDGAMADEQRAGVGYVATPQPPNDDTVTPADVIRAVNERWPHQYPEEVESEIIGGLERSDNWVLVERSTITGDHHLSVHRLHHELVDYQTRQECAEDWIPVVAVHLRDGGVRELQRTYGMEAEDTGETYETYNDWRRA